MMKTLAVIAAVVILPIAGAAYCSMQKAASDVASAPGRVISSTARTENIIFNYEYFFDVRSQYNTRTAQVAQYKGYFEDEKDPDERRRLRTEFAAVQMSCRGLVNDYNANAAKLNRGLFRDRNLPTQLDGAPCE